MRKTLPNDSKTIASSLDDLLKNKLKYKKLNKTDKDILLSDHNI